MLLAFWLTAIVFFSSRVRKYFCICLKHLQIIFRKKFWSLRLNSRIKNKFVSIVSHFSPFKRNQGGGLKTILNFSIKLIEREKFSYHIHIVMFAFCFFVVVVGVVDSSFLLFSKNHSSNLTCQSENDNSVLICHHKKVWQKSNFQMSHPMLNPNGRALARPMRKSSLPPPSTFSFFCFSKQQKIVFCFKNVLKQKQNRFKNKLLRYRFRNPTYKQSPSALEAYRPSSSSRRGK